MKYFNPNKISELSKESGSPDYNPRKALQELSEALKLNHADRLDFTNVFMDMRRNESIKRDNKMQTAQTAVLETNEY